jgi:hypothetical protein
MISSNAQLYRSVMSKSTTVANTQLERIWKEPIAVHFKALHRLLIGDGKEFHNKLQYYPVTGPN